jgi:predicted nucleic acid-binding protein
MITAVESSVLLDILAGDETSALQAAELLSRCAGEGDLIVCETVIAEVVPEVGADHMAEFLDDWRIAFEPSTIESAVLAGHMHAEYLKRGGRRGRVVPDFVIGAHAATLADRLVTRDAGFSRDYFTGLKTLAP